jgi:hypothetical protein
MECVPCALVIRSIRIGRSEFGYQHRTSPVILPDAPFFFGCNVQEPKSYGMADLNYVT